MKTKLIIPIDNIAGKIYLIRDKKVMLDRDLADLYGVETKYLKRAVSRNLDKFPNDFMFELNKEELENLRCQIGTSSWGGPRYKPMVFTEHGILMLSSVLRSKKATQVNIQIMRTFVKIRQFAINYASLREKIEKMESKYDEQFEGVFAVIRKLIEEEDEPKEKIGFSLPYEEEEGKGKNK